MRLILYKPLIKTLGSKSRVEPSKFADDKKLSQIAITKGIVQRAGKQEIEEWDRAEANHVVITEWLNEDSGYQNQVALLKKPHHLNCKMSQTRFLG